MPGLTKESQAGRLWAKAFTEEAFRENLKKDPRAVGRRFYCRPRAEQIPCSIRVRDGTYSRLFYETLGSSFFTLQHSDNRFGIPTLMFS